MKLINLMFSTNRLERIFLLLEIRLNHLLFGHKPTDTNTITFSQFILQLAYNNSILYNFLKPEGEAEESLQCIRSRFEKQTMSGDKLPFPKSFNADKSLALLSYGLARYLKPELVLETGVGYGITSALVLLALDRNNFGKLVSIDLPSLADPHGSCIGLAVPEHLKERWSLQLGSSRRCLPKILSETAKIGLFISDSANVYTVQRYEYETVYPKLLRGGAALFNNIDSKCQTFLNSIDSIQLHSIWQIEKRLSTTGFCFRK